ncbi:MAG TPA: metallophosphoesterase family protein [Gaiellaceae bacterium]|jgi:diadenosine tetraphosphatase ApaH/serine/threonine PP2A family protein phosphatase|nr:metallophosphoesterase family protein [Gaiellaceae bacterium]
MRVAVISDVHGNRHALDAVLGEIEAESVDAVWCLGDTVGYGPQPNECCRLVETHTDLCLVGNHDLVVLGVLTVSDFNEEAAAAALWTRETLTEESRAFLRRLEPQAEAEGVELFHASARDPVWEYVLSEEAAHATFELTSSPLVLVGHSHVALALMLAGNGVAGGVATGGTKLELAGRWLVNPGSVGQPRDGDPRAAWLLVDLERRSATFRRVVYPFERTQAEMVDAGLPYPLAARLARGE